VGPSQQPRHERQRGESSSEREEAGREGFATRYSERRERGNQQGPDQKEPPVGHASERQSLDYSVRDGAPIRRQPPRRQPPLTLVQLPPLPPDVSEGLIFGAAYSTW
jgi:hypothetical protein